MTAPVLEKSTSVTALRHGDRRKIGARQRQISLLAKQNTDMNTLGLIPKIISFIS
jgi:hypothetical protein